MLIKEALELQGEYEVTIVTDAAAAEKVVRDVKPALVLLDLVMPGRKGSDIATALKKDPETQKIPILMMSGLGEMVYSKKINNWQWLPNRPIVQQRGKIRKEPTEKQTARAYGVEDYLEKPFWTSTLIKAVKDILAKGPRGT